MCLSDRLGIALGGSRRQRVVHDWIIGALASLLASVLAAQPASASTWTGLAGNGLWNTSGNWSGGVPNATGAVADFSTLNITADNTVHMNGVETVGTLLFGDTTPSNDWILDNNGNAADILTLAVSTGSPTITVNNDEATISVVVAGTQGMTKSGAGMLLLSGNNTYSGTTAINAGTVALGNTNALGSTAAGTTIASGATLDLDAQAVGGESLTLSGTGVGGSGALINSSANAASLAGTVTAGAAFTVGGTGNITVSGSVNSLPAFVLTKVGNNTLTLSGTTDNSNLGATVNSGTLVLAKTSSGSPAVHAIGQATLTVSGGVAQLGGTGGDQIFDLGNVTVTSGTFDTNGRNETFSTLFLQGTGIANAGALRLTPFNQFSTITPTNGTVLTGNATIGVDFQSSAITLNNAVSGNFALTKTGAGTLQLTGTNTFSGGLTIQQGLVFVPTINNAGTNGPLGNNLFVTLGSSGQTGALDYQGGSITSSNMPFVLATGGTGAFILGSGSTVTLNGVISGSGGLTSAGSFGTLTLNANNTFTGGVTIGGGTLQLGNPGALNSSTPNAVAFSPFSAGTLSLNGISVTISGLTTDANVGTPVVQNGNATPAVLTVSNSAANTFAGTLQDGLGGGNLGLTKSSTGALTLSGNNTYSGATTINAGTLVLGNANALGATTGASVAAGATLDLGGQVVGAEPLIMTIVGGGVAGNGALVNGSASPASFAATIDAIGPFTVGGTGNITLSGSVNGSDNVLTKIGNNTLTLSGTTDNNSLAVTVNSGTVVLAKTSSGSPNDVHSIGQDLLTVNGGTAQLGGTGGDQIYDFGSVTVTSGVFDTNGRSEQFLFLSIQGTGLGGNGAFVNSGSGPSAITVNSLTLTGDASIGVTQSDGSLTFIHAPILGNFTLTKVGAGTLFLANPNVSNSPMNVNAGTLVLEAGTFTGVLNNSANVVLEDSGTFAGTTFTNSGVFTLFDGTFSGLLNNFGTVVFNGGTFSGSLLTNSGTFTYNGGVFNGRLINAGTAIFNADFTAGNGMENDANVSIPSGRTITLNGQGLDNEGMLTMTGGTLNLSTSAGAANVNRGNFNLSPTGPFNLNGATLTNAGTLNLNGGLFSGAAGLLNNGPGGTLSGPGTITSPFTNSGGLVAVTAGTLNITQPFANSGAIQLSAVTATLDGGAISNTGTINGLGNVGNSVTNSGTGTIEPFGGILYLSGPLANQAGGTIRIGTGNKLLVIPGLPTNGSLINLTGGTFDNGGRPLNNLGQISGYGVFASGGTGLDNNGSITFSGGVTTVNGPVTDENGKTITIAYNQAIFTGLVTNNGGATFNVLNTTATFAGGFTNNGNSNFAKAGGGAVEIDEAPTLANSSTLSVTSGTLRFNVIGGTPTIGTGVTAVVSSGATLELAGSVSALANGANRVNITNNSAAPGIVVSGTNQQVGSIDGSGTTHVNAGSDLTANHIVQSALMIGGAAGSPGLVTITASDASGDPLDVPSGFVVGNSLMPSGPFEAGKTSSANFGSDDGTDREALLTGNPAVGGNLSPVPEPSTLLLALLAILGFASTQFVRHHFRCQTA